MANITVADLAAVVYSSGKVFDGLSTGRLDTENFLRSGSTAGVTSRSDLALLEDLRDVSQLIIDHSARHERIDAAFVRSVNAKISRSGSLEPGELRTDPKTGVPTQYGRHEPSVLDHAGLQAIIDRSLAGDDPREDALNLFVNLAKAQAFGDGNKRTALFVANDLLLSSAEPADPGNAELLTVPVDENDPGVAGRFNDLLSRAYIFDEDDGVKSMLREQGFARMPDHSTAPKTSSLEARKAAIAARAAALDYGDDEAERQY